MGHLRLGDLPRTRKWKEVVALLGYGAEAEQLAIATIDAAEQAFAVAANDPGLVESLFILTQIPLAARSEDFIRSLREAGLNVSATPTLMEVLGAVADAVDGRLARKGGRTDLGEMAEMAAVETLSASCANRTPGLFSTPTADLQQAFSALATSANCSVFARSFFARLTERYLGYFLSRAYSHHVGEGKRFSTLAQQGSFEAALKRHCHEASVIVETFAGEWFSKTKWEKGNIGRDDASGFAYVALKKICAELKAGARAHVA